MSGNLFIVKNTKSKSEVQLYEVIVYGKYSKIVVTAVVTFFIHRHRLDLDINLMNIIT